MTNYWEVTVQFERENDRGRIQKVREVYLVNALSGTEAETKTHIYLTHQEETDFHITRLIQSRILKVLEHND